MELTLEIYFGALIIILIIISFLGHDNGSGYYNDNYYDNYYDGGSSGGFEGDDRTVDVHIRRIRNKIDDHSGIIETVFGIGYRMNK